MNTRRREFQNDKKPSERFFQKLLSYQSRNVRFNFGAATAGIVLVEAVKRGRIVEPVLERPQEAI
jgi:hypothetical protein